MVFSSIPFLFLFLPITLVGYFGALAISRSAANAVLLVASFVFYFWGEGSYLLVLVFSVSFNYAFALAIGAINQFRPSAAKAFIGFAIAVNLAPLIYFKYGNFLVQLASPGLSLSGFKAISLSVHLPLGISFFTFQAISYLVDVYRREIGPQRNFISMSLFMAIFPHQIAGPIVRYVDIADQIRQRELNFERIALGIFRFVSGLGKKVLLANPLGELADGIFKIDPNQLSQPVCWLGIIAYTMQIYLDFSGYSDMAIGIAKVLGLDFHENFNFPYIARSVQDFWRRWHISLSSWFRDYLYIPLGGNRKGAFRTNANLLVVFALCGLWHGASWSFVVWGLWHGLFLILERGRWGNTLATLPALLRVSYVVLVVLIGWVFFRAETIDYARTFLHRMFVPGWGAEVQWSDMVEGKTLVIFAISLLFCHPRWSAAIFGWFHLPIREEYDPPFRLASYRAIAQSAGALIIFVLASASLASGTYNPFIYFRF